MQAPATKKRKASTAGGTPTKRRKTGDYQKGRELLRPGQELKAFDVAHTATVVQGVAGPPVHYTMNAMVNGSELYQRVGRKVYMKNLHFRGIFTLTAAAVEQACRIIIYYDSQPNAAAPLIATLLQDSNAAAATTWDSEINLTNRQRFKILRDYQVILGESTALAGNAQVIPDPILNSINVDFFIKLKGLEAIYNGTNGGTVADITSGAVNMVIVGDTRADTNYSFLWTSRLRYYD